MVNEDIYFGNKNTRAEFTNVKNLTRQTLS